MRVVLSAYCRRLMVLEKELRLYPRLEQRCVKEYTKFTLVNSKQQVDGDSGP